MSDITERFEKIPENLIALYKKMYGIRQFEDSVVKLYKAGKIYGGFHTYQGEESVASGVCHALEEGDVIYSTHRSHGHALAMGVPMDKLMAELWGKESGSNGGRGGSMHVFYKPVGFMGSSGMVGGGIGRAVGAGFAFKYDDKPNVGVTFFGDGASNMGIFYESMNLASKFKLPVLFICENNRYATATPFKKVAANTDVASRASAFKMSGVSVDGGDPMEVYEAALEARERAICGEGPTLIECRTYRQWGHYIGDIISGVYRSKEEMETFKAVKDPVKNFRECLLAVYGLEESMIVSAEEAIQKELEDAITFAENSPVPNGDTVLKNVFAEEDFKE